MPNKDHVHDFKLITKAVPLHAYDIKRKVKGSMTGKDTLKQFKCKCGKIETIDLKRVKA